VAALASLSMGRPVSQMSLKLAREVLGVSSLSTPAEIRYAFRDAAKRAHPDSGGDEAAFRQVMEAYRRLQHSELDEDVAPKIERPTGRTLEIPPHVALDGGDVEYALENGRSVRIALPAGLRTGDKIRAGGLTFSVYIRAQGGVLARGDDLWLTVKVAPATLKKGGRLRLDTPLGKRLVWIDRKAAERGLVRLEGQGLPPRGRHPRGHLFLRLSPETSTADSAALALIRRFTSAWAA
jgi:curved DNA-binding protein